MAEYNNVEFFDNKPVTVEFSFDPPFKTGTAKTGKKWIKYGVRYQGADASFFATPFLHDLLQWCAVTKGMVATICIRQRPDNKSKKYWTCGIGDNEYSTDDMAKAETPSTKKTKSPPEPEQRITPSLDDIVNTHVLCYSKVADRLKSWKVTPEVIQKIATSVAIQASKEGIVIPVGQAREMGDVPPEPPDDLPWEDTEEVH